MSDSDSDYEIETSQVPDKSPYERVQSVIMNLLDQGLKNLRTRLTKELPNVENKYLLFTYSQVCSLVYQQVNSINDQDYHFIVANIIGKVNSGINSLKNRLSFVNYRGCCGVYYSFPQVEIPIRPF